jgi:hypothetical protein
MWWTGWERRRDGGLAPLYEPTFHGRSHGLRPGRSGQTALVEARQHVEAR